MAAISTDMKKHRHTHRSGSVTGTDMKKHRHTHRSGSVKGTDDLSGR